MGWFDEQIEFRKKHERELLSDSIENIARSVTGRKISSGRSWKYFDKSAQRFNRRKQSFKGYYNERRKLRSRLHKRYEQQDKLGLDDRLEPCEDSNQRFKEWTTRRLTVKVDVSIWKIFYSRIYKRRNVDAIGFNFSREDSRRLSY